MRTPHPDWKPGDSQPIPYEGDYITLDPAVLGGSACYPLVISAVVPRPIGFLSTQSDAGKVNLSPYSYFGAMGHDPPLVRSSCTCAAALLGLPTPGSSHSRQQLLIHDPPLVRSSCTCAAALSELPAQGSHSL